LDGSRVSMMLAVLERRARLPMAQMDVYTATVGGVRLVEPAADLAIALAVASARSDLPLPAGLVAIGEVGLAGDVRRVAAVQRRLAEAHRLGFTKAIVPPESGAATKGMRVVEAEDIRAALTAVDATLRG
jgi:DNA repair protein RadA/Sms